MINYDESEDLSKENLSYSFNFHNSNFGIKYPGEDFFEPNLVPNNSSENQNNSQNLDVSKVFNEKDEQSEDLSSSILMLKNKRKRKIFFTKKQKKVYPKYKKSNFEVLCITAVNKYFIKKINERIKQHTSLKNIILHTPSYEDFSEKIIIKENRKKFLTKKMKHILKEKKIKKRNNSSNNLNDNSNNNSCFIKLIEETNDEKLISLLNMSYKEVIKEFYNSFDFVLFKFDEKIIFYEREFMRRNKKANCKSLIEKDGLIDFLEEK